MEKIALITGASRGIGRATAIKLAQQGYSICINYKNNHDAANEYIDYAATKGAIDTLTIGLANEVAPYNIRVNGVRPGFINTTMHADGGEPNRLQRVKKMIPLGRGGEPEEVANTIAWLLSDEASYITGTIVDIAGGR